MTLGVAFFVVPVILQQTGEELRLQTRGVKAQGEVLRTWDVPGGARTGPSYHCRFVFQLRPGGPLIVDEARMTNREFWRVRPHDRIPIVYDPAEPSLAALDLNGEVQAKRPRVAAVAAIVFLVMALTTAWALPITLSVQALRKRGSSGPRP